jgi:DNA-binding NtrC family response regulator
MDMELEILILEDNNFDADLIQRELVKSKVKFNAVLVNTRDAYRAALERYRPDLILSDYAIPSFDGVAAFQMARKIYPDIPFIVVSGTIGEENAIELIKGGVADYILKDKLFSLGPKLTRAIKEAENW